MKPPLRFSRRTYLGFVLAVGALCHGQPVASSLGGRLPTKQVAIEGRSVSFKVTGVDGPGAFQWQVAYQQSGEWVDLADDGVYSGSRTQMLEITKAELSMGGSSYRFTVTEGAARHASNSLRLIVSPLLLRSPVGIAAGEQGVLYVTDTDSHAIWRVFNAEEVAWGNDVDCPTALVAGSLGHAGAGDGVAEAASFNRPSGIANGVSDDYWVTDTANAIIRRLGAGARITTVAGATTVRGNDDGVGTAASFGAPEGIARGPDGAYYVADASNHTIRKITADGVVSTLAGSPGNAGFADGRGSAARFNRPTGVAVDGENRIYVTDTTNNLIRTVSPDGEVQTLAGVVGVAGSEDGEGKSARFNGPTALAVTRTGRYVYIADTGNSTIRTIDENGVVRTFAGVPGVGGLRDGEGYYDASNGRYMTRDMLLNQPRGIYMDGQGLIFIADTGNAALRVISLYEGLAITLPLVSVSSQWSPPVRPPFPSPTPNPVPRTISPSSSGGSSGGGAIALWFLPILAALRLVLSAVSTRPKDGWIPRSKGRAIE